MELPRQDQFLRNCQTTMHWGNKMNGPNCDKLLHHAKQLTDFLPHDLKKFGIALERFQDFKMACFTQDLKPDWPERLELLKEAFDKLGVRMTPKIHCLLQHVPEFFDQTSWPWIRLLFWTALWGCSLCIQQDMAQLQKKHGQPRLPRKVQGCYRSFQFL